jgi:hypothetical protein
MSEIYPETSPKPASELPVIAVLTPTKGRQQHLEFQVEQMKLVKYPQDKIRWIITDTEAADGKFHWSRITALYENAYYIPLPIATSLGKSRNIGIQEALVSDAEFIFLQDDDDIICQERFQKAIEVFRANPDTHLVGCSAVITYNLRSESLMQIGQFGPNHSLEPTLAFTRSYAETHQFDDKDRRGRLAPFLEKFTAKMVQVPARDCCVIIGHNENTFDKYQIEERYNDGHNGFNIQSIVHVPLKTLCEQFGLSKRMQKLFKKAYKKDLDEPLFKSKAERFLIKLKEQYGEGLIDKEMYVRVKEFLEDPVNYYEIYQSAGLEYITNGLAKNVEGRHEIHNQQQSAIRA